LTFEKLQTEKITQDSVKLVKIGPTSDAISTARLHGSLRSSEKTSNSKPIKRTSFALEIAEPDYKTVK